MNRDGFWVAALVVAVIACVAAANTVTQQWRYGFVYPLGAGLVIAWSMLWQHQRRRPS